MSSASQVREYLRNEHGHNSIILGRFDVDTQMHVPKEMSYNEYQATRNAAMTRSSHSAIKLLTKKTVGDLTKELKNF